MSRSLALLRSAQQSEGISFATTTTVMATALPAAADPESPPNDQSAAAGQPALVKKSIQELKELIQQHEGHRVQNLAHHPCRALREGVPRGAIVNIHGANRTAFVAQFLAENPKLKTCWVEDAITVYPPALAQAGVPVERILFVAAETQVGWALGEALRSQLFDVVVCEGLPETQRRYLRESEERNLRRFQIQCGQTQTTLLLLSRERVQSWPIGLSVFGAQGR